MSHTVGDSDQDPERIEKAFRLFKRHGYDWFKQTESDLKLLADSARENPKTRRRLASELVTLLILAGRDASNFPFKSDYLLRCIGNSCIDNPEAAKKVIGPSDSVSWVKSYFGPRPRKETQQLLVKVLYNVCVQNEEAAETLWKQDVHYDILRFLADENHRRMEDMPINEAVDLLLWMSSVPTESSSPAQVPEDVVLALLELPHVYGPFMVDTETFASFLETTLIFLRQGEVQTQVVQRKLVDRVWTLMQDTEKRLPLPTPSPPALNTRSKAGQVEETDNDDAKLLLPVVTSLTWVLSDLAAHPSFAQNYSLQDPLLQSATTAINSDPPYSERTTIAALHIITNYLVSSSLTTSEPLSNLYDSLFSAILATPPPNPELLHSAAGLLIQLSRPSVQIREHMVSDENCLPAIRRMCEHSMSQVKQSGVKLVRALGQGSEANQKAMTEIAQEAVVSLKAEAESQAQVPMDETPEPSG